MSSSRGRKDVFKCLTSAGLLKLIQGGEKNEESGLKMALMQLHACELPLKTKEEGGRKVGRACTATAAAV